MLKKLFVPTVLVLGLTGCQTVTQPKATANADSVMVGSVGWQKSGSLDWQALPIPENQARLVFIRPATNFSDQSSANIAINGQYVISLQADHYTQQTVCNGPATISVLPTAEKSNDLRALPINLQLEPNKTYYFTADVSEVDMQPTVIQLSEDIAHNLIQAKALQTHQITRVVNDCKPVVIAKPQVKPVQQPTEPLINIRLNILFDNDKSVIKPIYYNELAQAAEILKASPDIHVVVEGHTDSKASDAYNIKLSQRRASAVSSALINQYGINPTRISAVGYGERRPVASNTTAEGRTQNRRVMVISID